MENQKNISAVTIVIATIITLVVGIIIGCGGVYVYSSSVDKKDVDTNKQEESQGTSNKNDEANNEQPAVGKVEFYSGDKYTLTLVTHYDVETTTAKGTNVSDVNEFIFTINEYYSGSSATGTYRYDGNAIILSFTGGCTNSTGEFYCTLPEGVNVTPNYNELKLTYSDDAIYLGNIKLVKDK